MEYTSHYNSPLGQITLASNGTCLTGLWFEGQKFFARTLANCTQEKDLPVFDRVFPWNPVYRDDTLALYFKLRFQCESV